MAYKKIVYSSALATVVAVLIYLSSIPGVKITTSGDITCAGTNIDPCVSYFNITSSNYSLKFYKFDQRLGFSPETKNYTLYKYTSGKWRETKFPINMTKGTLYQFKIVGYKFNPTDKIKWAISSGDANIDPYWLGEEKEATNQHSFIFPPKYDNELNIVYDNGLKIIGNDSQGQYNITLKLFIESDNGQKVSIAASKSTLDFIKINPEAFTFNISVSSLPNKTKYVGLDFEVSNNVKSINQNDIYPNILEVHGGNSMIMIDFSDVMKYGYNSTLNVSSIKIPTNGSSNVFVDPQVNFTRSQTNTIYLEPFNSNKFVLAWCDGAIADGLFQFWDTNGTNVSTVNTVDSDLGGCGAGQIAVASLNSTHIVVAWVNSTAAVQDSYFQVYEINTQYNATPKGARITVDATMGAANRINIEAFNSTAFIVVWNDLGTSTAIATYAIYDSTGAAKVTAKQIDTNCGGNVQIGIAAATLNSTHAVVAFSDRTDADITYAITLGNGTHYGPIDADTSAGTGQQFIDIASLNSTYFVIGYHDNAESDATLFINTSNMIGGPSIAGDVHTSIGTGGWLGIAKFNDTHTIFAYQDGDTNDLGSNISSTITSLKYMTFGVLYSGVAVAKNKTATNIGICNDDWIIAYGTNTTNGYWETYDSGYNSWNGICPSTGDSTPPIVTIQSPTNTTYNNSVAIWGNVSLNEAGSWCGVNNDTNSVNLTMTNSSGNWNYNFNAPLPAKGTHYVRFYCNDTTGNMNQSALNNVTFTIDNTVPTYNVVGTNNTAPSILDTVLFYANWTDNLALGYWIFSWNGTGAGCNVWANDTAVKFNGGTWSNATETYPIQCLGKTVDYEFYVNDTSNNWNNTVITVGGTEVNCWTYKSSNKLLIIPSGCVYYNSSVGILT